MYSKIPKLKEEQTISSPSLIKTKQLDVDVGHNSSNNRPMYIKCVAFRLAAHCGTPRGSPQVIARGNRKCVYSLMYMFVDYLE